MTAWHDKPSLSRRQARKTARDAAAADVSESSQPKSSHPESSHPKTPHPESAQPKSAQPNRAEGSDLASAGDEPLAGQHIMTRRELRALRERAEAAGEPTPNVVLLPTGIITVPVADVAGVIEEKPVTESEQDEAEPNRPRQDEADPAVEFEHGSEQIPELIEPTPAGRFGASPALAESALAESEVIESELIVEAGSEGDDVESEAPEHPSAEFDPQRGIEPAPEPAATPFGHWSSQAALNDAEVIGEPTLGGDGEAITGVITTHALVLPSIPESGDQQLSSLTSTGEIMVTGTIDLPRTFGSTGAHPALFDHPDVDALMDASDREDVQSDSAPVRAIHAVSSNTSGRSVIEASAPRKSRLPLIVARVAGAVLLIVVGIVAAGFIFNVF